MTILEGDAAREARGLGPPMGTRRPAAAAWLAALGMALVGCGDEDSEGVDAGLEDASSAGEVGVSDAGEGADAGSMPDSSSPPDLGGQPDAGTGADGGSDLDGGRLPYAEGVVGYTAGSGAGFGQADFPEVVLGPPSGGGPTAGGLDVLSLGVGGEIVVDFGDRTLLDGPGPDFVVFENPFWLGNDPTRVFAELGEVAVSLDGTTWATFFCDIEGEGMGRFPGCAGWTPTLDYDAQRLVPIDPILSGGDAFDLSEVGLPQARFVRIRDLADSGSSPTAGFDLDAVGAIHLTD